MGFLLGKPRKAFADLSRLCERLVQWLPPAGTRYVAASADEQFLNMLRCFGLFKLTRQAGQSARMRMPHPGPCLFIQQIVNMQSHLMSSFPIQLNINCLMSDSFVANLLR